jgi:Uncharacterised protein family (UPF0236)
MHSDPDRDALIDQALARLRKKLQDDLPSEEATLDEIEEAVDKIGTELMRDLQRRLVQQRAKKPRDNQSACACGTLARYRGLYLKSVMTAHGLLRWKRPYYYCGRCQRGFAPLDARLGLDRSETTRQVRLWSVELAAHHGFEHAAATLRRLRGLDLSAATLERLAVQVGTSLRAAQRAQAHLHQQDRLPDARTACPRRLYIGADGIMTPLRDAWKKDGSLGRLQCRYAECKTGVVYQTQVDKTGRDSRVQTKSYVATLGGVALFEGLLATQAHYSGQHAAREVVVLGDGAPWIWLMFARLCPGALQILDFYHACEHLGTLAEAMFGAGTEAGREWQQARQAELKSNQVGQVLQAIAAWKPKSAAHHKLRRTEFGYFRHNAARMRYQTYLQQGYHIGSGVVEAACKHVIGQRLDQAGMHWRQETAEAIITLRAAQLSTHPPDLRPHLAMVA